jgi:hypothetical protein
VDTSRLAGMYMAIAAEDRVSAQVCNQYTRVKCLCLREPTLTGPGVVDNAKI